MLKIENLMTGAATLIMGLYGVALAANVLGYNVLVG